MIKLGSLRRLIGEKLKTWLSPEGFEYETDVDGVEMYRWKDDVFMRIACVVNRIGGDNRITPFGQMGFRETQEIWQKYMLDPALPFPDHSVDLTISYAHLVKDWSQSIVCNDQKDLEQMHLLLSDAVQKKLYPMLMEYRDPVKLFELYLSKKEFDGTDFSLPSWRGYGSALRALILSKLYAPQYYMELKKRYRPIFKYEIRLDDNRNNANNLIAYLDSYQS